MPLRKNWERHRLVLGWPMDPGLWYIRSSELICERSETDHVNCGSEISNIITCACALAGHDLYEVVSHMTSVLFPL